MSTSVELRAQDVKVFCEAAAEFFRQTTGQRADVRTAYLAMLGSPEGWHEFSGVIGLSGRYRGRVVFSAPRGLLSHVLMRIGERDYSEASHRDIVGEIANQMSGYARRHFGDALLIAPPQVRLAGQGPAPDADVQPVVIPLSWQRYEAHLLVGMAPA